MQFVISSGRISKVNSFVLVYDAPTYYYAFVNNLLRIYLTS